MNRDVLSQLPPEAGHPPEIAARLKKPACGMSDAPRRWWKVLDKALCSSGVVPTRADRCGYVLYSNVQAKLEQNVLYTRAWHKMTSHLNRVCDHVEMEHLRECWIPLKEARQIRGRNLKPFLQMIPSEKLEPKWNNVSSPDLQESISKLVQKILMTCSSEDKVFVG